MRDARLFLFSLTISAVLSAVLWGYQATGRDAAADWLARPTDLPHDVFDLQEFKRYRSSGGNLDLRAADAALRTLTDQNLPAAQRFFDVFAWKAFVALNWAADPNGRPDQRRGFDDDRSPRVWEFWRQSSSIFLPDGRKPEPWVAQKISNSAADHFKAGWRQTSTADQGLQAFSGPLVDQNGKWVHYQAFVNEREFHYIVDNELYNLEGQAKFTAHKQIDFPVDDDQHYGSIELKMAWKILTPEEAQSGRFFIRKMPVVLYRPPLAQNQIPEAHKSGRPADNGSSSNKEEVLGMVGMHIAMRTRSSPQWIWATFEQVDNTRIDLSSAEARAAPPREPNFSRPDDPETLVRANLLPAYNAVDKDGKPINDWDETRSMHPVEVLRIVPPPPITQKTNREAQAFLRSQNSILRFYELIGTQWPKQPNSPAVPGGQGSAPESIVHKTPGDVVPIYLINSTMETYFQRGFQEAGPLEEDDRVPVSIDNTKVFGTESCVGCHYSAGACIGFKRTVHGDLFRDAAGRKVPIFGENSLGGRSGHANFSWMLQIEAKSKESLP